MYAAAQRARRDWIIIKAVCDWGSGKAKGAQTLAARNAVSLMEAILEEPGLDGDAFDRPGELGDPALKPTSLAGSGLGENGGEALLHPATSPDDLSDDELRITLAAELPVAEGFSTFEAQKALRATIWKAPGALYHPMLRGQFVSVEPTRVVARHGQASDEECAETSITDDGTLHSVWRLRSFAGRPVLNAQFVVGLLGRLFLLIEVVGVELADVRIGIAGVDRPIHFGYNLAQLEEYTPGSILAEPIGGAATIARFPKLAVNAGLLDPGGPRLAKLVYDAQARLFHGFTFTAPLVAAGMPGLPTGSYSFCLKEDAVASMLANAFGLKPLPR